jgi:rRNA processing protein Gar1
VWHPRSSVYSFYSSGVNKHRLAPFAPKVMDGSSPGVVNKVLIAYGGTSVILGGSFTSVNGVARSNLAKVSMTNSTTAAAVLPFAQTNGSVADIERAKSQYIVSGSFTSVNGHAQVGLASVNQAGSFTTYFHSKLAGTISDVAGPTKAAHIAVSPQGTELVAIVNTSSIDGQARRHLAKWNLGTSSATLQNWVAAKSNATACQRYAAVRDIAYAPDGANFYTVASGGPQYAGLCDQAIKWSSAARGTVNPVWASRTCGDTMWSALVFRGVLYSAGHMKCIEATPGGTQDYVARMGIFALNADTGRVLTWRSDQPRCEGGKTLAVAGGYLFAGTDCGDGMYARPTG